MSLSEQHILNNFIDRYDLRSWLNEALLQRLRLYSFEPGQEVYIAKNELDRMYFLVQGKAQVSYYLANGKRSIIAMISPFSVIGDIELFEDKPLQLDVIATEKCLLLGLNKADVKAFGYDDPVFLRFMIHHLSRKLRGSGYLQLSYDLPLVNRVANYLLVQPETEGIIHTESKEIIADLLGTSLRHLNRVIKTLEDEEILIREKGRITVKNREKLKAYGEL